MTSNGPLLREAAWGAVICQRPPSQSITEAELESTRATHSPPVFYLSQPHSLSRSESWRFWSHKNGRLAYEILSDVINKN